LPTLGRREPRKGETYSYDPLSGRRLADPNRWKIKALHRVLIATVIQWLGSNVGWCFLTGCIERCGYRIIRIEDEKAERAA
jgi:hypothetical protein